MWTFRSSLLRWAAILLVKFLGVLGAENSSENSEQWRNDEKELVDKLLRHYDPSVRPVHNAADSVVIRLGITLTQIFDLDEKNQVLTTNVWLDQEWVDEFMVWNPDEYANITKIRIPCEKLWLPDIVLYNSADDYTRGYMNSRAMVNPDGNVFWPPPTKFRSTCPVDVTYFPFDDQICTMKLGSWIYDGLQVDVMNRTSAVDLDNYVPNGEWELMEARLVRNVVRYPCCPEPFPDVTITLVIRRKTLYYMYNVVMPCMMMSVLTLLVFCLPPDSGEKIALGVTVLLAFSVFMLAIAEKMPETSESIPLLGIYLTAVMAITSISVVMTVIVLNFHYRGPNRREVPSWMRRVILDLVASCTCVKYKNTGKGSGHCSDAYNLKDMMASVNNGYRGGGGPSNDACRLNIESFHDELKDSNEYSSNESLTNANLNDFVLNAKHRARCSRTHHHHCGLPGTSGGTSGLGGGGSGNRVQDEILRTLRYLLARQEQEDHYTRTVNEWRQIAIVIDRLLFWIFFIVTLVSSLLFLVLIPVQRRGPKFV